MKNLLFLLLCMLYSQAALTQYSLMGNVTDTQGNYLPGATILLHPTDRGAISNADGFFIISNLPKGSYTLAVSYVGYETFETTIELKENVVLDLVLKDGFTTICTVVVKNTWADANSPVTHTNIPKEEIEKINLAQDVPYLLKWTPSLVVTSDAGAGIGYTGMRIRGSDPTRINVSINGVPLNDAESQGVFWVDLPDFLSSTEQVQIQRGVGTSTNGAGAFGATINLNTTPRTDRKPSFTLGSSLGSFNTWKSNAMYKSGLIAKNFMIDARLSYIHSDGYIDRAQAKLASGYFSMAYLNDHESIRLNVFSGHEKTYQAWNGVPPELLNDPDTRTFNSAGTEKPGEPHDNEVDDYTQTHIQALYTRDLSKHFDLSATLHYTKGKGFFEQYKAEQELSDYGLSPLMQSNPDTTFYFSDLIRRRWLDNDFYGVVYALQYKNKGWDITLGGALNQYDGKHFGEVIAGTYLPDSEVGSRYYDNDAKKLDENIFLKTNYRFHAKWYAYLDLQQRFVRYSFLGFDREGNNVQQKVTLPFFNPKVGLLFRPNDGREFYTSFALAHREPNRDDYTESSPHSRPLPERLYDTELGYRLRKDDIAFGLNLYHMFYKNQLILTGQINDVGAATRMNVPKSYRMGIEVEGRWQASPRFSLSANASLSKNKIEYFTEYVDSYDADFNWIGQQAIERKNTDIAFSPAFIGSVGVEYIMIGDVNDSKHFLSAGLHSKYVSKQYIDNSQSERNILEPYFYTDLLLIYHLRPMAMVKDLSVKLSVNNIFNALYESNAWSYRYYLDGQEKISQGFYPQAGRHFLLGLTCRF